MSSTGPAGSHGPSSAAGDRAKVTGAGSQLHGHYQYAKGAVEEILGKVTGVAGLRATGKADQTAGLTEMRAAKHRIDPSNLPPTTSTSNSDTTVVGGVGGMDSNPESGTRQGLNQRVTGSAGLMNMEGKVERTMGNVVGCKGMQEEGAERVAGAEALRRSQARGGGSGGIEASNNIGGDA